MPADKKTLLESIRNIFVAAKAMPDGMDDIEDVLDIWTEPDGQHRVPDEGKIKTGPREDASGEGAFKMVGEYSNPAPQHVATEAYDEFSRMLDKVGRSMKAMAQRQHALEVALFETAKSAPVEAKTSEPTFIGKAEARLKAARIALRKADMADEDEREEREDEMEKANRALISAKRLLAKAEDEADDDEDEVEKVEKAVSEYRKLTKAFAKAKSEFVKAEDEAEKKDYDEEKKRVEAKERDDKDELKRIEERNETRKAETEDKEDEREKEEHKKSADPDRLTILETSVQGLMNTIAGTSKYGPLPDFMKSFPMESIADKIEDAIDSGKLREDAMVMKAKDLHARLIAAKAGNYDPNRLQEDINSAPDAIRNLFKTAA